MTGDRQRAQAAGACLRLDRRHVVEQNRDLAADQVVHGGSGAAVGHVDDVDAGEAFEQFAGQMIGRAVPRGAEIQCAGRGLASATSSATVLAFTRGLTVSTICTEATSAIGAKSVAGSNAR